MHFPPWLQKKLIEPSSLEQRLKEIRKDNRTLATLNGSFDLLHAGHLYIVHQASLEADFLLVALNSDQSIQKYKSIHRPIVPLKYRLEMMAALEFVDYVTWFDETDPREFLLKVKPDIHVNGMEYGESCIEADVVKQVGARLHLVNRIDGLATSQIVEKIRQEPLKLSQGSG